MIESDLNQSERHARWPSIFNTKSLKTLYKNKGQASKHFDKSDMKSKYNVAFSKYNMFRFEGAHANLSQTNGDKVSGGHDVKSLKYG